MQTLADRIVFTGALVARLKDEARPAPRELTEHEGRLVACMAGCGTGYDSQVFGMLKAAHEENRRDYDQLVRVWPDHAAALEAYDDREPVVMAAVKKAVRG